MVEGIRRRLPNPGWAMGRTTGDRCVFQVTDHYARSRWRAKERCCEHPPAVQSLCERATEKTIVEGITTYDLGGSASMSTMTDAIIRNLG